MDKLVVLGAVLVLLAAKTGRAEDTFLISLWCGPTEATQEKFAEVAAANFNVAMFDGTVEQDKVALDLCKANGIKALIWDSRIMAKQYRDKDFESSLDEIVKDYSQHPALWGYYVTDEPNSSAFKQLGAVSKYLLKKDPKHVPFINLFPTYANPEQLGNPTYEHHVDEFCRVVRPALISYDHYALMADGERTDYFDNMEIIRRQGIKHKTPFSYILLSVPHGPYRDPSETDLRWQVNTALAYGARGIMYFTYTTPNDPAWNFREAIIGADGKPTRKYAEVTRINAELKKLAPTLMKLNSVAVYHTSPIPLSTKLLPQDGLIGCIEGGEFVIGQFNSNAGERYTMLVNRSLRKACRATVRFSSRVKLYEVSPVTGRLRVIVLGEEGTQSIWRTRFAPAQGRLLKIESADGQPLGRWEDKITFRPRVMLNPSMQFANVIMGKDGEQLYNEGLNMYDIAVKVKGELDADGRMDVFISRMSREHRVDLDYETDLTRDLNCDALVSLHSDATGTEEPGGGTWTFYADEGEGKRLAECVQSQILDAIRSFYPEVKYLGVRTHWYRLWVLHASGCPASLTEVLFHTNPKEREMLKDPTCQQIVAKAVARGILNYFGLT